MRERTLTHIVHRAAKNLEQNLVQMKADHIIQHHSSVDINYDDAVLLFSYAPIIPCKQIKIKYTINEKA